MGVLERGWIEAGREREVKYEYIICGTEKRLGSSELKEC
jgi:hypothetical protein